MEITLTYGAEKSVAFEVPDPNVLFVVKRNRAEAMRNVESGLRMTLMRLVGTPKLSKMINRDDNVLIIADDNNRLTPQNILLPPLVDELNASGIRDERIEILVALGTHRRSAGPDQG
jgi:nickel-dependent lactate racemase